jgi:hypothetical protein
MLDAAAEFGSLGKARERPPDACPYPKPFPEGFDQCPAFEQRHFIPLDTTFRPLSPVLTCRHLITSRIEARSRPGWEGSWYAACELGDARARLAWVEGVDPDRLARIRAIRKEMERINRPFVTKLWEAKAALLAAQRETGESQPPTRVREIADQFLAESESFLKEHAQAFLEAEIPPKALMLILRAALDRFVEEDRPDARWEVPDELLKEFPDPIQIFFRPGRPPRLSETGSEMASERI